MRWDNSLVIYAGETKIVDMTIAQAGEQLSGNVITYDSKTWLRIPQYQMLFVDKFTNTLAIRSTRTDANFNSMTYQLMVNGGYANITGGALFTIQQKKTEAYKIFNSVLYNENVVWLPDVKTRATLAGSGNTVETYTFFTDPHCMGTSSQDYADWMQICIGLVQKVNNSTTSDYIVCGGDWLNSGDSVASAQYKLAYIDGFMNSMFKNFYNMIGNHDTNYQGAEQLSNDAMTNLWFRKYGKCYYKFQGSRSTNYVLDTGLDWDYNVMSEYRWEQVDWLGESLLEDDPEHSIVFMHIVWNDENKVVAYMADNVTKLIAAYNAHSTITLNSKTYNFTGCTGHIDFVQCGHIHDDYNATVNGVVCIASKNFGQGGGTIDLVTVDYTDNKVYLTRVGSGSDREISLA